MPAFPQALAALPPIEEPEESEDLHYDIAVAMDEEGVETNDEPEEEATETPETPAEPEDADEPSDEPDLAAAYQEFGDAYRNNPVKFLADLTQGLDEGEKTALLASLGIQPNAPSVKPGEDEGWTDDEMYTSADFFVREHRQQIADLPKFQKQVADDINTAGQYISHLAYQNALLEARLSLALDAAGVSLPDIDEKAVQTAISKGKTYKDAFAEAYVKPTQRTLAAQKAKAEAQKNLPKTPRDSGAGSDDTIDFSELSKKKNVGLNDLRGAALRILAAQQK